MQYAVDVNTLEQKQVPTLGLNGIGLAPLELDRPVAFDPYRVNRDTGSFILSTASATPPWRRAW